MGKEIRMTDMEAYIWDLDGTLIDSYNCIVSSLVNVADECHLTDSYNSIMKTVKQGAVSTYLRDLSARCGKDFDILLRRYREISHAKEDEIGLIPGALETLQGLRPAQHFVYTHRGSSTANLLNRLGLTGFFREIVTFEYGFRPKPSGEGVTYLVEKYNLPKNATAYVGDRTLDIYCAKDAGVHAILYLPDDSCVIPAGCEDRIIRHLEELL